MQQRHEDLGLLLLPRSDGGADDARTTGIAVLVAQPLVDASRRVALLAWRVLVVTEDLCDDRQEGTEDGFGTLCCLPIRDRLRLVDDLVDGTEVEPILLASLTQAQLVSEDTAPDLGVDLHVVMHSCLPRSKPRAALRRASGSGSLHFSIGRRCAFRSAFTLRQLLDLRAPLERLSGRMGPRVGATHTGSDLPPAPGPAAPAPARGPRTAPPEVLRDDRGGPDGRPHQGVRGAGGGAW